MKIETVYAGPANQHWYCPASRHLRPKGCYITTSDGFMYGPFDSEPAAKAAQVNWSNHKMEFNQVFVRQS